MKKMPYVTATALILLWTSLATADPGDLPYRRTMAVRAASSGLGSICVPQLVRLPGPGRTAAMEDALARYAVDAGAGKQAPVMTTADAYTLAKGDGWMLEVRGTGDWVRYRNEARLTPGNYVPVPVGEAPNNQELERMARRFVSSRLAPLVKLGPDDALRGWYVTRILETIADDAGAQTTYVIATKVVFTREVNGIPVLGSGSKVAVLMGNDGEMIGFDVDWPQLTRAGRETRTVDLARIRARVDRQLGFKSGAQRPPELIFECGYYDPGADASMAGGAIAPACQAGHDVGRGFRPFAVVPIGEAEE